MSWNVWQWAGNGWASGEISSLTLQSECWQNKCDYCWHDHEPFIDGSWSLSRTLNSLMFTWKMNLARSLDTSSLAAAAPSPTIHPHSILQGAHGEHPEQLHHYLLWKLHCIRWEIPAVVSEDSWENHRRFSSLLKDIFHTRCSHKTTGIMHDPSHGLLTLLPSGSIWPSLPDCATVPPKHQTA